MNLGFFIARRYFLAKGNPAFINVLSGISMLGLLVGTAALVIVLSAFNGLQELIRGMFNRLDAPLVVQPSQGKFMMVEADTLRQLASQPGVLGLVPVLEDNALIRHGDAQTVVRVKGVDTTFLALGRLQGYYWPIPFYVENERDTSFRLSTSGQPYAMLGMGVASTIGFDASNRMPFVQLLYPKGNLRLSANPDNAFQRLAIQPGALVEAEPQFDDRYVVVPLAFARRLVGKPQAISYLEVVPKPQQNVEELQESLQAMLGTRFRVLQADQLHADLYRVLSIEKLFIFVALAFILIIASFNVFVSLSMVAIEKRKDLGMLQVLGAGPQLVGQVLVGQAVLIALCGAGLGLVLGLLVCLGQQAFGWVRLGIASSVVDAYPIALQGSDFALVLVLVVGLTYAAAWLPALRSARQRVAEALRQ